tara:strand:- start:592 stop:939 length:348 start_codon:yes stop_codon:yes gene_type:complete
MRTLNDYFLTVRMNDVSTAGSVYVAIPDGGKVIKILSVLGGTIATADAVITAKVGSDAMTGGTITIAHSGSNTGDIDTCEPTAANIVEEGGYVTLTTSGASTNTHTADFTIVVRR